MLRKWNTLSQSWYALEMVLKNGFSLDDGLSVKKLLGIEESGPKGTKTEEVYS